MSKHSIHTYDTRASVLQRRTEHTQFVFFVFVLVIFFFICVLFVFNFMFCRQLNGTGRFHGLASLDDIAALISTPSLAGFQVASPN